jgi:hypothetical protein
MLEPRTSTPKPGMGPVQDALRCSHMRTHAHISTDPPQERHRHRPEPGSVLEASVQPLFTPLACCPPKLRARYRRTGEQAGRGWSLSAVKLKCLDCCGWEYTEAKRCEVTDCPLWLLNRRIFAGVKSTSTTKETR